MAARRSGLRSTVGECLCTIGIRCEVDVRFFEGCETLSEEFSRVKKSYFKTILLCHPDKGGDADVFREVLEAFEVCVGLS